MTKKNLDPCGRRRDPWDVRKVYRYEKKNGPYWSWVDRHSRPDEFGNAVEPAGAAPDRFIGPDTGAPSDELRAVIEVLDEGGLDRLTVRQRRAFKLVLIAGMTYAEAARRMGIRPQTVREHVLAAGKKVREMCKDKV